MLTWVPPKKDMLKSWPSAPESVTLCGNRVFTEIIKWKWGSVCLIHYDCVLGKGSSLDAETDVHRRKMMWRRTGWTPCDQSIHLQVKKHQNSQQTKPLELAQRGRTDSSSQPPVGTNLTNTLISDLWPPESWEVHFCYSSQPICGTLNGHLSKLTYSSTLVGKITERKGLHLSLFSSQLFRRKAINNP